MNKKKLKRRIRQCEAEIEHIKTLPYYTLFNRESERNADLQEAINKLAVISWQLAEASLRPHNTGVKLLPSLSERGWG